MLTTTHDTATAWLGIGSALLHISKPKLASITVVLCVFLYLGSVLVLHITTPALFALEVFNSTQYVPTETEGLPVFDPSGDLSGLNLSQLPFDSNMYVPL